MSHDRDCQEGEKVFGAMVGDILHAPGLDDIYGIWRRHVADPHGLLGIRSDTTPGLYVVVDLGFDDVDGCKSVFVRRLGPGGVDDPESLVVPFLYSQEEHRYGAVPFACLVGRMEVDTSHLRLPDPRTLTRG